MNYADPNGKVPLVKIEIKGITSGEERTQLHQARITSTTLPMKRMR